MQNQRKIALKVCSDPEGKEWLLKNVYGSPGRVLNLDVFRRKIRRKAKPETTLVSLES